LKERLDRRWRHGHTWILAGWLLFIVSALFFIGSAWRSGDCLAFLGGVFFLVACIVFLVPVLSNRPRA